VILKRLLLLFVFAASVTLACTRVAVTVQDKLGNVDQLDAKSATWFQKDVARKYGLCYVDWTPGGYDLVFGIAITPDTYHGNRVISSREAVHDQNGNQIGSVDNSSVVPYSVDYGIYDLYVLKPDPQKGLALLRRFQQKGLYSKYFGIPLGGRGYHPLKTVIEDAAKWVAGGK
jgi:hypothetical protein